MRWFYLLAGLLALATGSIHAVMGGIDTLNPLMASDASMEARVTIMAVWHSITLVFTLSVFAYFWAFRAEKARSGALGVFLGLFYLLFAGIFAALSYAWFEDPMTLPQWTLLAPLGLISLVAAS